MNFIDDQLKERLSEFARSERKISVLTGAGLSADSGIPTFRGPEGFWTIGSENYMPEEMGTLSMFKQKPLEVWYWFLYRFSICNKALPNIGHVSIKALEDQFQDRFRLITQNVDGLHFKAGSSPERSYLIHGSLEKTRCGSACSKAYYPFPDIFLQRGEKLSLMQIEEHLICPNCGNYLRPNVLWFDEYYNEEQYKLQSAQRTSKETGLLLIVGTSGATNLPRQIVEKALSRQAIVVDINPNENYFSKHLEKMKNGFSILGKSSDVLPEFVDFFRNLATEDYIFQHLI